MSGQVDGLWRALQARLDALGQAIDACSSRRTGGRTGVTLALQIVRAYPGWVREFVSEELENQSDDRAQATFLGQIALDVAKKARFVEEWFAPGSVLEIPSSLAQAIRKECLTLGAGERHALLAVGAPNNFIAAATELKDLIFGGIGRDDLPGDLPDASFAMIQLPRLEGTGGLWWPVVLGHELAHLRARDDAASGLRLREQAGWDTAVAGNALQRMQALRIATAWTTELICDAYCVHRFGPGGVAAMVEYLDYRGATQRFTKSHPPAWLRARLMLHWVGDLSDSVTEPLIGHALDIATSPQPSDPEFVSMIGVLGFLESLADPLMQVVLEWGVPPYTVRDHEDCILEVVEDLEHGVPPRLERRVALEGDDFVEPDVINGGWLTWLRDDPWPTPKLVSKALDDAAFIRLWRVNGGNVWTPENANPVIDNAARGVVPRGGISARLGLSWNDECFTVATPLVGDPIGVASLDVRLGNRFIVFERTDITSIRTFTQNWDSRSVQRGVEVGWGQHFVLHPGELVLASTLEYIVLPRDLSAQVVTRSSYGRVGLICATAVQVHPHFKGCLTLELVNLGVVPLVIAPGEHIAQLVFVTVSPPADPPEEEDRSCATGPEFSRPYRSTAANEVLARFLGGTPSPADG